MMNKKAQNEGFSWIIGAIVAIMLLSIILPALIQWYATTTKTEDSFDSLITTIESLEDEKQTSMIYFLPDDKILVSFAGEDFKTGISNIPGSSYLAGQSCTGTVQIPDMCGSSPCLCVCSGSYKYGYEDSCIESAVSCYPFTSDATKNFKFTDTDCNTGVYREGSDTGVFTLFLQRIENEIKFCSTKECVNDEQKESVEKTKELLAKYKSCMEKSEDCSCSLDFTYLGETRALNFYSDKVQLVERINPSLIYTDEFETQIAVKDSDKFIDTIILFLSQELITLDEVDAINQLVTSTIVSPSIQTTENSLEIKQTLYKKDGKMYFVSSSEDISSLSPCENLEKNSDPFSSNA